MKKLFIDTGAYLSYYHKRDMHHKKSVDTWHAIIKEKRYVLITTNHIIDEFATLLGRRKDYQYSAEKVERILLSDCIIERPNEDDEKQALKFFKKYADQEVSFTDCLSFVVMQKMKIQKSFTFDRHFEYAGFEIIPS